MKSDSTYIQMYLLSLSMLPPQRPTSPYTPTSACLEIIKESILFRQRLCIMSKLPSARGIQLWMYCSRTEMII